MEKESTRKKRVEFVISSEDYAKIERQAAKQEMKVAAFCRARALQAPIRESPTEEIDAIRNALGVPVFRLRLMIKRMDDFDFRLNKPDIMALLREICEIVYKKDITDK